MLTLKITRYVIMQHENQIFYIISQSWTFFCSHMHVTWKQSVKCSWFKSMHLTWKHGFKLMCSIQERNGNQSKDANTTSVFRPEFLWSLPRFFLTLFPYGCLSQRLGRQALGFFRNYVPTKALVIFYKFCAMGCQSQGHWMVVTDEIEEGCCKDWAGCFVSQNVI